MAEQRAASAVVFGYGDIGARCLAVLLEAGIEVPLVATHRDDPNETRWYASVFDLASQKNLRVVVDPPSEEELRKIRPDLIFSFYYRNMLPMPVLKTARLGAYNVHGSLLPKYRGRAPLNWAVLHGESETGVTLHEMVEKPDAGGIVDQQTVPIGPDETAVEVFHKMTEAAVSVLKRNIDSLVRGTVKLKANDLSKGSYFGRRKPEDGRIDWSRSAREIHDLVRAVAPPFPGAFSENLRINKTKIENQTHNRALGPFKEGGQWFAACGDGKVLRLLDVQEK